MGEVAFLLGFEEVNSFLRAFHTWEGTALATWRARASARKDELQEKRRSADVPRRTDGLGGRAARANGRAP
jgi:hypothetical protein